MSFHAIPHEQQQQYFAKDMPSNSSQVLMSLIEQWEKNETVNIHMFTVAINVVKCTTQHISCNNSVIHWTTRDQSIYSLLRPKSVTSLNTDLRYMFL